LFILLCFSIEYIARLWSYPRVRDYALSWYGAIDLAAIMPSALSLFLGAPCNLAWLRVLRLLRLLRALKLVQQTKRSSALWSGILARTAPFMGVALACKTLLLFFEGQDWWIDLKNLGPIIAMIGFAIGVLLGSKLSVVQARMHKFEDSVIELTGILQDLLFSVKDTGLLLRWSSTLEDVMRSGRGGQSFLNLHDEITREIQKSNIGAPISLSFQQKTAYIINKMKWETPQPYNEFLQRVTIFYTVALIIAVPGIFGFLSVALTVYILGGMYFVISDMDRPIDHDRDSLINADFSSLTSFNARVKENAVALGEGEQQALTFGIGRQSAAEAG
jgi:hypothetical protein